MKLQRRMNAGGRESSTAPLFLLVLACFWLSGVSGLIYQVLWVRMIDKVVGSAPFAVATVLSVFMGGLAAGSYAAGKRIDRIDSKADLLGLYGKIEMVIGLYALALPSLMAAAGSLYAVAYDGLFDSFWLYQLFTFLGCCALLILPTSLMGATLPVLCRYYVHHTDHLGGRTGRLYGLNTLGASLGALLCGFVLIGWLGVQGTLWVASGMNLTIGALCLCLSLRRASRGRAAPAGSQGRNRGAGVKVHPTPGSSESPSDATLMWALGIFAVSGFCSMAYEVFWTRLLGLILGPTTYSFTLVVTTFIVGLGLGSILFGWIGDRTPRVFHLLVLTQAAAAMLALAVSQFLGSSQLFFAKLIHTLQNDFGSMLLVQGGLLFVILVGPTVLLGATFPLVNRIYARSVATIGQSIGSAYAVNTLGAILGSFAAGFVLIPLLGKEGGLRLVILIQWGTALAGFLVSGRRRGQPKTRQASAWIAACACLFLIWHFPSWDRNVLSRGWYRNFKDIEHSLDRTSWLDALIRGPMLLGEERRGIEVVFYGDGIGGFTTVEKETTSLGTVEYALYNSGKPDASSHGDRSTQTLSGHIPLLFHPRPEKVMVLGLASGMTPGEVLHHPMKRLDILEINDQVVKACGLFFTPWNNGCLTDPRTRLIVQDGRNHLALTRERYDVIISEPSNPWMAGLANLYTLDFFQLARDRLNDRGIFAQWIQSYEMDWETFALLGRTFARAFPDGVLMKIGAGDYLMLGFRGQERLDWEAARHHIEYARRSTNVSVANEGFLVHLIIADDLVGLFGEGPVHTDDRPRLELSAPRKLYGSKLDLDGLIAKRRQLSDGNRSLLQNSRDPHTLLDFLEFGASAGTPLFSILNPQDLGPLEKERYETILRRFCREVLVPSYQVFPLPSDREACARIQVRQILAKMASDSPRADDYYNLSLSYMALGHAEEGLESLRKTVSLDPFHKDAHTALGLALAEAERMDEAVEVFARVVEISPRDPQGYLNWGVAEQRRGRLDAAASHFACALGISPDNVHALNKLGRVRMAQGKYEDALNAFASGLRVDPEDAEVHLNLAGVYYQRGEPEKALEHLSEALRISPDDADIQYNFHKLSKWIEKTRHTSTSLHPGSGMKP